MKEPKRFKLNLDSPSPKEPLRIPLKSINQQAFDENLENLENSYDAYHSDKFSTYIPKDLENFKK